MTESVFVPKERLHGEFTSIHHPLGQDHYTSLSRVLTTSIPASEWDEILEYLHICLLRVFEKQACLFNFW